MKAKNFVSFVVLLSFCSLLSCSEGKSPQNGGGDAFVTLDLHDDAAMRKRAREESSSLATDGPSEESIAIQTAVPTGHGEVLLPKTAGQDGEKVVFTAYPDEGYKLASLTVDGISAPRDDYYGYYYLTLADGAENRIEAQFEPIEYRQDDDHFSYTIDQDGNYVVTAYTGSEEDVVIPSEHNYRDVTGIATYFDSGSIRNLEIPASISSVQTAAFSQDIGLQTVHFDSSDIPVSFGTLTFAQCYSLLRVDLPNCLDAIQSADFAYCGNLGRIDLPDTLQIVGNIAFEYCNSLLEITIPDGVTTIGDQAFYSCDNLKRAFLPNTIDTFGNQVFYASFDMEEVTVAPGNSLLYSIDGVLYFGNTLLFYPSKKPDESYTIPYHPQGNRYVVQVESFAFTLIQGLKHLTIEEGVKALEDNAFYYATDIQTIDLPSTIDFVSSYTFAECHSLESIHLSDRIAALPDYIFSACSSLKAVTGGSNVAILGSNAFSECASLESFDVPEKVTEIPDSCFFACTSLRRLTLNDGLVSIGNSAFYGTASLRSLTVPASVTQIASSAFASSGLESLELPGNYSTLPFRLFWNATDLTSFAIPDGVATIDDQVFYHCASLVSLYIPKTVVSIGSFFIDGTSLTSIRYEGSAEEFDRIAIAEDNAALLALVEDGKIVFDSQE